MGANFANDIAMMMGNGMIDIHNALQVHLRSNHYPPLPARFATFAEKAITACADGNQNDAIALCEGMKYKGAEDAPAIEIVRWLNLQPFVNAIAAGGTSA